MIATRTKTTLAKAKAKVKVPGNPNWAEAYVKVDTWRGGTRTPVRMWDR